MDLRPICSVTAGNFLPLSLAGIRNMFAKYLLSALIAAAGVAVFCGEKAQAQEPANTKDAILEEVIVTARYRKESLQEVPLSESVYSAQQIEDARIDKVGDFIGLTPNVTLVQSQNAGTSFMTIRGITQVRNGEPPIAVVVDGVLEVSPNQFTQQLFDIQSIEVVRGPQGALYGRNATGGAIIITTRQPTNATQGHFRTGYGKGDEKLVQASVSGPIKRDELYYRVGARYLKRDGYYKNITLNKKVDYLEDFSFRGLLKWTPTEKLEAALHLNGSHLTGGANNFVYQPTIFGPDGRTLSTTAPYNFPFDYTRLDANDTSIPYTANNLGYNERDIREAALKVDYDMGFATLTSTSSYNKIEEFLSTDQFPYTAARSYYVPAFYSNVDGTVTQYLDVEAWSQELRLTSSSEQRFRWMAGVYYLKTNRYISTITGDDLGQGILRTKRMPAPPDSINPTNTFFGDANDNEAWAVFGQINYDLTDQLEASAAIRYDKDKRKQMVSPYLFGTLVGQPGAVNRASFDLWQPKLTLRYKPRDNLNLYTSWGKGFRSGQFNQNGVSAGAAALGLTGLKDVAGQEETKSFEIGFKSDWLDERLRFNAALFQTTVNGQHYFVFIGVFNAQILENIDKVDIKGSELELTAHLSDNLDAYASYGFTDSEIKAYARVPGDIGNWAPYVPDSTFNIGVQFRQPISRSLRLFARADYERRGKQYWDPENSTARSPLDMLTLRLGLESSNDTWSLIGTINNALDETYNAEWSGGGFAQIAPPRTWAIDFQYNF